MLTSRQVEYTKPGTTRIELPDRDGLYLVIQPSGKKSWAFRYRHRSKPRKIIIGRYPAFSLADAREDADKLAKAVDRGDDPARLKQDEKRRQPDLVRTVGADFIEKWHKPRNRTWREVERTLKLHVYPAIGDLDMREVTRRDILALLDKVAATSPYRANRVLAFVSRFFGWAVERSIIDASPVAGIKRLTQERNRDRVLNDDEVVAFLRACQKMDDMFGRMFRLLLLTAARRSEIAAAAWAEFDLAKAQWSLPGERSKNRQPSEIPLASQTITIIEGLPSRGISALLFPSPTPGRSATGFGRAKRRLDRLMLTELRQMAAERPRQAEVTLPDWRLHDLRRTAASGMARLGVPIHVVERLLNHVTGQTVGGIISIYQKHDYRAEKEQAVQAWADFLDRLMAAESSEKVVKLRSAG